MQYYTFLKSHHKFGNAPGETTNLDSEVVNDLYAAGCIRPATDAEIAQHKRTIEEEGICAAETSEFTELQVENEALRLRLQKAEDEIKALKVAALDTAKLAPDMLPATDQKQKK